MARARARSKRVTRNRSKARSKSGGRSKRSRKVKHSINKTRHTRKHMKGGCAQCFASM